MDVINIKRVAFGVKELSQIRQEAGNYQGTQCCRESQFFHGQGSCDIGPEAIEEIVGRILRELL